VPAFEQEGRGMAEKKIAPAKPATTKTAKSDSKAAATRVTKKKNFKKVHAR
jgi:hypothetical protein